MTAALVSGLRVKTETTYENCLRVDVHPDQVAVGCTAPIMYFTHDEWQRFLDRIKAGEFDLPSEQP